MLFLFRQALHRSLVNLLVLATLSPLSFFFYLHAAACFITACSCRPSFTPSPSVHSSTRTPTSLIYVAGQRARTRSLSLYPACLTWTFNKAASPWHDPLYSFSIRTINSRHQHFILGYPKHSMSYYLRAINLPSISIERSAPCSTSKLPPVTISLLSLKSLPAVQGRCTFRLAKIGGWCQMKTLSGPLCHRKRP